MGQSRQALNFESGLSLIMPSFQGAGRIDAVMQAFALQVTTCQWELIVVIDGSTDATLQVLEA